MEVLCTHLLASACLSSQMSWGLNEGSDFNCLTLYGTILLLKSVNYIAQSSSIIQAFWPT